MVPLQNIIMNTSYNNIPGPAIESYTDNEMIFKFTIGRMRCIKLTDFPLKLQGGNMLQLGYNQL